MTLSKEALAVACAEKVKQLEFSVQQSAFDSVRHELETELAIARVALLALRERAEPVAATAEITALERQRDELLAALEAKARQRDCHTLRLETGIHQHAAIALYTRNGYQTRCAFAPYQPDPLSVFMEKPLFADLRSAAL
mgnify:CR=1 FL=1